MLTIYVNEVELYDELKEEFITIKAKTLQFEHSLISLSKWESEYKKPFLTSSNLKTDNELYYYLECMCIQNITSDELKLILTTKNIELINTYIDEKRTATWFNELNKDKLNNEQITSELLYYWMIAMNIPLACEKWHLSRLLTLIKICNEKNKKPTKLTNKEISERNRKLNEERRAKYNSKG